MDNLEFTFDYTASLFRQAVWKSFGNLPYLLMIAILILGFCLFMAMTNQELEPTAWASAGLAICLFCLLTIFYQYIQAGRSIERFSNPRVSIVLSDQTLTLSTELGVGQYPWSQFRRIIRTPNMWLLSMSTRQYVILPTEDIPESVKERIENCIRDAGGVIT